MLALQKATEQATQFSDSSNSIGRHNKKQPYQIIYAPPTVLHKLAQIFRPILVKWWSFGSLPYPGVERHEIHSFEWFLESGKTSKRMNAQTMDESSRQKATVFITIPPSQHSIQPLTLTRWVHVGWLLSHAGARYDRVSCFTNLLCRQWHKKVYYWLLVVYM